MMTNKIKSVRYSLGLALMFIGMQFATAVRNINSSINLVDLMMVISFILLIDYQNLSKGKIDLKSFKNKILLMIIGLMLIFACGALISQNNTYLFYHLYVICICIAFMTHANIKNSFNYLPYIICILGGIISIVVFYQATLHFTNFSFGGYELTGKLYLEEGGDPITIPRSLVITGIAFLFLNFKSKTVFSKIISIVLRISFLLIIYLDLLAFANRSSLLFLTLIIFFYFISKGIKCKNKAKSLLISLLILVSLCILILNVPFIRDKIVYTFENTINALGTMFGKNGYDDSSGATRFSTINFAIETLNNSNIWNIFFGNGYMFEYIDVPALQIFVDLGFFIGLIYIFLTIILPLFIIFKSLSNKKNVIQCFIMLISIQYIFDQFYCGTPYNYFNFIYIISLVSFFPFTKYKTITRNKFSSNKLYAPGECL